MTEPTTTNVGLIVPNTGDLAGLWGSQALNPDLLALDGYVGATQIISVSNAPITLTSPAGFTPTPSGGPTQAQNAVLSFTGTMSANVQVTLPLPGVYQIENLTTGDFVLTFAAANAGQVIAIDQGESMRVYCNGTNVRFGGLPRVGQTEIWAGLSAMPAWVTACTVPPYLLCDGAVYNFSDFPYLGKRLGGAFGGNGVTTFGVPDSRGRLQLPYDGTGTRITVSGCGLNGQTLGAVLDHQTNTLITANLPPYTPSGSVSTSLNSTASHINSSTDGGSAAFATNTSVGGTVNMSGALGLSLSSSFTGNAQGGASTPVNNVQPAQVTGIAVIRAG